jgi:hypothetical protein
MGGENGKEDSEDVQGCGRHLKEAEVRIRAVASYNEKETEISGTDAGISDRNKLNKHETRRQN